MKKIVSILAGLAVAWSASAGVVLPEIIGDGMVLQQRASVRLWGWAEPRTAVTVETSWGESGAVRSGDDGRWVARLQTPAGSYEPRRITIGSGGDSVTLCDVLIGEVWFAGGQSNMEMPLGGFTNCPVEGANDVIARAGAMRDCIRYAKIDRSPSHDPQLRVGGRWCALSPETAPRCSAVGYFFAEMLSDVLDVPVGIIDCTVGGTRVEGWLSREVLAGYPDVDLSPEGIDAGLEWLRPLVMFNGMVNPLTDYTIRGFLWYQGESNVDRYDVYAERLADLAALWRERWGEGDIPFYFVEIAPFGTAEGMRSALLREAQCRARTLIPNSGMVSTNDLVEPFEAGNIHPRHKREVGRRLACWALNRTYGFGTIACESPEFEAAEFRDGRAWITLSSVGDGFGRLTGIEGFEICGADRVFRPAEARVDGTRLVVSSPEVAEPVAVRYAFRDYLPGNLTNLRGLPVVPFRTDDF